MQSRFEPLPRSPELRAPRSSPSGEVCGASCVGHRDVKLPLLLDEAVEALMHSGGPGAVYVDGSLGHGGHSAEILRRLDRRGRLLAFDVAPAAELGRMADERMEFFQRKSEEMRDVLRAKRLVPAGVLLDLGVQMTAAEEKERGLSYYEAVPLDGRLDRSQGIPASLWLQQVRAAELASVLQDGEGWTSPLLAHRLAEAILHRQAKLGPYRSTLELAEVICSVKGSDDRGFHPAKQAFQAMRRFLNQEIGELEKAMESALCSLENGGRLIVITTCRKEASAVKRFLRHHEAPDLRFAEFVTPQRMVELFPLAGTTLGYSCRQLCDPIRASAAELARNPRAKVALLHVLQKEERSLQSCKDRGLIGLVPRPLTAQFRTPAALPLHAPDDFDERS